MTDKNRAIFADADRFYAAMENPKNTEAFWRAAADTMEKIAAKHGNDPLALGLLCVCYDTAARIAKGKD